MTSSSTSSSSRRRYTDEVKRPEDVIAEIIVRLPIKSILRFKSTYSLTESPHFIKLHRTRHILDADNRQNQMLFSSDQTFHISMISPPPSTNQTTLFHLGTTLDKAIGPVKRRSFMGGICALGPLNNSIYCVVESDQCGGYTSKATIYNLVTRKFELFNGRSPFTREAPPWLVRNLKHRYGFGCLMHNDVIIDYKMVAIKQDIMCYKKRFRFSMYSLCSGSWSQITRVKVFDENGKRQFPIITQDSCLIPSQPLMFNGRCHWMAKWPGQVRRDDKHCVVRFDMTKEVFITFLYMKDITW